ncbi:cell division protein FtsQ/DivIB [Mesorhizobium koreense]|uniref:cell division protein FtsQ/DivIB n=1 Tax=Mesorhizobium koreense TaxID=3074855 RepID=UPI00287B9B7C|nr:cell division protein FtsQ/DivIB [Mesorhizobium sp. WR6]
MSALMSVIGGRAGAIAGPQVLPRFMRGPARFAGRLFRGDVTFPRLSATIASAFLFAATGAYGAYIGGQWPAVVQAVTSRTGFAIDNVHIVGNRQTSEIDVLGALGLDGWTSQIGFSAEAAREKVLALPWVEAASVHKIYPGTVEIAIKEKTPYAIWQHGSELTLIQKDGGVIAPFSGGKFASLPLVVGIGAATGAAGIVAKIDRFPNLAGRVKGYVRVGGRRWDITFDNGVTVKLPETDEDQAIADLARLDQEHSLLSRDILAVDMRLENRLFVQLTPEAAEARAAAVKERAKQAKKSGRDV